MTDLEFDEMIKHAVPVICLQANRAEDVGPSIVRLTFNTHFCRNKGDWRFRWKDHKYFVKYCVGGIEEIISFSPNEVEDAVVCLVVEQGVDLNITNLQRQIEHEMNLAICTLETYVCLKHKLPIKVDVPKCVMKMIKSLVKKEQDPASRTDLEAYFWSKMILGLVGHFVSQLPANNCLVISDSLATMSKMLPNFELPKRGIEETETPQEYFRIVIGSCRLELQ